MSLAENALTKTEKFPDMETEEAATLINIASDLIESYCNRQFKLKQVTETYRGPDSQYLLLRRGPIDEIEEIKINGEEIDLDEIEIISESAMIFRLAGWRTSGYDIEVTYTGGYVLPNDTEGDGEGLPNPLEYGCILLVKDLQRMVETDSNAQRYTRGGVSVSYFERKAELSAPVKALVGPWRYYNV